MPAKSSRPGKRGAAGGKGFNPFRASDGKFAPGAHKAKPKVAKTASDPQTAALKTGKRYTARAAHWSKKADEAAKAGNAEALKFAQKKAKQAHEKVQKALGDDHVLTKQAKTHSDKAHDHASGVKPNGAVGTPVKTELAKVDTKTIVPAKDLNTASTKAKNNGGLSSEAAKKANRYNARAKHWDKKAQEAAEKAKNATTDVDRKIAEAAAAHAAKKAQAAAKLVEKAAGKDHPLTKEAQSHAESAKVQAGVKVAPKSSAPPPSAATVNSTAKAKVEKGEHVMVTPQSGEKFAMEIEHVGGTNIYGKSPSGAEVVVPLKAKDQLSTISKKQFDDAGPKLPTAAELKSQGLVPNTFSPKSAPGPAYKASKPTAAKDMATADFQAHSSGINKSLTLDERSAVLSYSGANYVTINSGLRTNSASKSTMKTVTALDSAMAKSALPHDTTLYRGAGSASGKTGEMWGKLKPGDSFQDSGFTSTSIRESSSFASGFGVKLVISAPKGYPGLAMNDSLSHHSNEKEVLLPRNTRFRVVSNTKNSNGGIDVHVEIVPNHD